ncbi:MAG: dihydrodipicolinate synthase family protein, partial [Geminicoccaceae bacterium]
GDFSLGRESMSDFHGIYPILYAFFDGQGRLDREAMRRQTEACVKMGAHGIAALGLATEVSKLSAEERHDVMSWLADDVDGRLPIAITVFGKTPAEQIAYVKAAEALGAGWVILQPPQGDPINEAELIRFFGKVMDASAIPVAIQNAPQYLNVGLSDDGLHTLCRNHANFQLLKGEGSALQIRDTIEAVGGALDVFNGRGGLELTDNLRAGCKGMIPAPECADVQVRIFEHMNAGDEAAAERLYADILPLITFLMQSVDQFLCYGKRLTARRLGLNEVHDRAPCQQPTDLGLACLERYSRGFGPFA